MSERRHLTHPRKSAAGPVQKVYLPPRPGWNGPDRQAAQRQGWDIFSVRSDDERAKRRVNGKPYGHRPFELQALDESSKFPGDTEAQQHVFQRARRGDQLCIKALAFLYQHSRPEYQAIVPAGLEGVGVMALVVDYPRLYRVDEA